MSNPACLICAETKVRKQQNVRGECTVHGAVICCRQGQQRKLLGVTTADHLLRHRPTRHGSAYLIWHLVFLCWMPFLVQPPPPPLLSRPGSGLLGTHQLVHPQVAEEQTGVQTVLPTDASTCCPGEVETPPRCTTWATAAPDLMCFHDHTDLLLFHFGGWHHNWWLCIFLFLCVHFICVLSTN